MSKGSISVTGNVVTAVFPDGIRLTFTQQPAIAKQASALTQVCLLRGSRHQVTFNAPRPDRMRSQQPTGFAQLVRDWSVEEFAGRWRRVLDYVGRNQSRYAAAWAILRSSDALLKRVEDGEFQPPRR